MALSATHARDEWLRVTRWTHRCTLALGSWHNRLEAQELHASRDPDARRIVAWCSCPATLEGLAGQVRDVGAQQTGIGCGTCPQGGMRGTAGEQHGGDQRRHSDNSGQWHRGKLRNGVQAGQAVSPAGGKASVDVLTSAIRLDSMKPSELFVHELAHLVWLLVYRPGYLDDQKAVLRRLRTVAKESEFKLVHSDLAAFVAAKAGGSPSEANAWLTELSTRMAFHTVRSIDTSAGVPAAELLGLARALSSAGTSDEPGAAFDKAFVALAASSIAVQIGRHGFSRAPTPVFAMRAYGLPARTPATGITSVEAAVRESAYGTASLKPSSISPMAEANAKPRIMQGEFMPASHMDDLVIRLRGDIAPQDAPALLDEVTRLLEDNARHGAWAALIDLASKVMEREATVTHPDVKRAFTIVFKRLAKPGIMRGSAQLLPRHRDLRGQVQAFLARQGDVAIDMLIELLVGADSSVDRRAYRDALRQLPDAKGPLRQLLDDPRWYVVRNAAELLGELHAVEADQALIETLKHRDARVRHAATLALIKLGTPRAVHTILRALSDADASVRLKAAHGLGVVTHPNVVPALLAALDNEADDQVSHAILLALAHHPADPAVQRLVHESGSGSLLKRRPVARRLAAVQALGESTAGAARDALQRLAKDKDRMVRDLAGKLLREGGAR